jgi:SAM-dependent methyltransferase
MNEKDLQEIEFYNEVYSKSEEYRKHPYDSVYAKVWKTVAAYINAYHGKIHPVYEFGCGSGQLANLLLLAKANYVYGWDYSSEAIKLAKEINPKYANKFGVRDVRTFSDKYFSARSLIVATELLEHLDDGDDIKIVNTLNIGTKFVFSVPDFPSKIHKRVYPSIEYICKRYPQLTVIQHKVFKTPFKGSIFLVYGVRHL